MTRSELVKVLEGALSQLNPDEDLNQCVAAVVLHALCGSIWAGPEALMALSQSAADVATTICAAAKQQRAMLGDTEARN